MKRAKHRRLTSRERWELTLTVLLVTTAAVVTPWVQFRNHEFSPLKIWFSAWSPKFKSHFPKSPLATRASRESLIPAVAPPFLSSPAGKQAA